MVKANDFFGITITWWPKAKTLAGILKKKIKGVITTTWNNTTVPLKVPKVSIRKEI